jgi:hypothetical protein
MPTTQFKLSFETKEPDIDLKRFQQSLPSTFKAYEENGNIYISLETSMEEDENAKYLVDRAIRNKMD